MFYIATFVCNIFPNCLFGPSPPPRIYISKAAWGHNKFYLIFFITPPPPIQTPHIFVKYTVICHIYSHVIYTVWAVFLCIKVYVSNVICIETSRTGWQTGSSALEGCMVCAWCPALEECELYGLWMKACEMLLCVLAVRVGILCSLFYFS